MKSRNKGAALILVLMIVSLMSIVTVITVHNNRLLLKEAQLLKLSDESFEKVKNTSVKLMDVLLTTPVWLLGVTEESVGKYNLVNEFNLYGHSFQFNGMEVTVQDESGLVSLYPFDDETLKSLIVHKGYDAAVAEVVVDSIADWIDPDDFVRLNGAEKLFYQGSSNPRNGPIQSIDELLLVRGMTRKLWDDISPFLTLFSTGSLNLAYANDELLPVALSSDQVEKMLKVREKSRATGDVGLLKRYNDDWSYPSRRLRVVIKYKVNEVLYQKSFTLVRTRGAMVPFYITDIVVGNYGQSIR